MKDNFLLPASKGEGLCVCIPGGQFRKKKLGQMMLLRLKLLLFIHLLFTHRYLLNDFRSVLGTEGL